MNNLERIVWEPINSDEINYLEINRKFYYWFVKKFKKPRNKKVVNIRKGINLEDDNCLVDFQNIKYRILSALYSDVPTESQTKIFDWAELARIMITERLYWKKVIQILDLI